jgi:predicted glycosyltransferase
LRDILVEKTEGQDKFERRAVDTLNNYFSGLLIHADPDLVTLGETFGRTEDITTNIYYTGFITPKPSPGARVRIRKELSISETKKLIVASIGSGSVGGELIEAAIMGVKKLTETRNDVILQVFTGPYLDESKYLELCAISNDSIRVSRFTEQFPDWLAAADLSLSMAGYNTSMNVLRAGVPALLYPFDQNREQRMRISRISSSESVELLERADLGVKQLSRTIDMMLNKPRFSSSIMLDGAVRTAAIIEDYHHL